MIRAEDISKGRRIAALCFLLVAYFFYAWSWNTVDILRPYIKESLNLSLNNRDRFIHCRRLVRSLARW